MKTTATPYLCCKDSAAAIDFYRRAFGAAELSRIVDNGRVSHAEIRIGDAAIFLSDEHPESDVLSPDTRGGSPVMIVLSVPDVDAMFEQAVDAGAAVDRPLQDGFGGKLRTAKLIDPAGHRWMILTENVE
jgi:PhnB protein